MEYPCGFYGGSNAKHGADLRAGMVKLQGHQAEVIGIADYPGDDPLPLVRGKPSAYVVMCGSDAVPVKLEIVN